MNWKAIEEKYPKAFELLKSWAIKSANIDASLHGGINFPEDGTFEVFNYRYSEIFPDRRLYDFFDEHRLYVVLEIFDAGEFAYQIHTNERYSPTESSGTELFGEQGNHTTELTSGMSASFDKRSDAENAAFIEAFSLMEKHFETITEFVIKGYTGYNDSAENARLYVGDKFTCKCMGYPDTKNIKDDYSHEIIRKENNVYIKREDSETQTTIHAFFQTYKDYWIRKLSA